MHRLVSQVKLRAVYLGLILPEKGMQNVNLQKPFCVEAQNKLHHMVFLFSLLTDIWYYSCSSPDIVLHSQGFCNGQLRVWYNVGKSEQAKKYRALNVLPRVTDICNIIPVVVLVCAVQ